MKAFILFFLLITNCIAQKTNDTMLNINYEAKTRGSFNELTVLGDTVKYSFNQQEKTINLKLEDKEKLISLIKTIALEKMNEFTSTGSKRAGDRALHATLKIKKEGKEYKSITFDHGNPPKELESLVNVLMNFVTQ